MKRILWQSFKIAAIALVCAILSGRMISGDAAVTSLHATLAKSTGFDYESVRPNPPKVNLRSVIVVDSDKGQVLYAKNADLVHPIASISKLVAAMVVLDQKIDLDSMQTITQDDAYQSSFSHLRVGWQMSLRDLLYTALMISDNRATRALARAVSGTYDKFVVLMNQKAQELGLHNTVFGDPTGLDSENVSTASELAMVLGQAYKYNMIASITSQRERVVTFRQRKRLRTLQLRNTNHLIGSQYQVLVGKTGFIEASAYCLATMLKNSRGERLTMVLLGAPRGGQRFREARKLADWGFKQIS